MHCLGMLPRGNQHQPSVKPVEGCRGPARMTAVVVALAAFGATLTSPIQLMARSPSPPNVVLIMADDLGYGDIGCFGSSSIRTPHLDALAKGGLKLMDYHSNGAVCSPTRAALMTGRYQQRAGIEGVVTAARHRHTGLALDEVTFAELLGKVGYRTAMFGKWHLGYAPRFNPVHQGFDRFRGYVSGNVDYHSHIDQAGYLDWWDGDRQRDDHGYSTDLITGYAVSFIRQVSDGPFCLYVAYEPPHYPLQGRHDPPQRELIDGKFVKHKGPKDGRRAYREMIEVMDEGIGKIVAALEERSLRRQTLIFFCSDNGPTTNGSAGVLHGHKGQVWEGGHRVPAIANWPGTIQPGGTTDQTVIAMDLFPTLAELARTRPDSSRSPDGTSLVALLKTGQPLPERMLFWQYRTQRAARQGPWKLVIEKPEKKDRRKPRPQLFHLGRDLAEQHDLSQIEAVRTGQMVRALEAWYRQVTDGVEQRT